ncbi:hypothetical protein PHMEG_00012741 [Phytophthora megakarya]|uniref:Reverse transcriptase RNase H-like domain-containing protein n=1 Tax=Phytophthora megakarya TaxID=4795 RepID=A0A225W9I1_9STRA|nr:hypothetical protein PHMEG_00012741 [Phytophthora megakarya]
MDEPGRRVGRTNRINEHPPSGPRYGHAIESHGVRASEVSLGRCTDDWAPADAGTALRKWKKKLRAMFGVEEIAPGRQVVARQAFMPADTSQAPLPQTSAKPNESSTDVFGSKGSPYMHDSHMVTPRSASHQDRVLKENEASRPTPNTYKGDLTMVWARQIRELSVKEDFQGGALHWYRQLPRKTRRTWKRLSDAFIKYYCSKFSQSAKARYYSAKREDKEHMYDYLSRLNGYACTAGVQFENGGRKAKDHVEHFLDTDESPYRPRITLADALSDLVTALNETSVGPQTSQPGSYDHEYESNENSIGACERRDNEDRYCNICSEYDYAGEDERGHVAAANDHERRAAAEVTFARSDNRCPKGDIHFNNDRGFARDNHIGRQQYGSCAACGGLTHSVHYCYKRCKMCKQVHDAGKCETFNELASILRWKVDKNDLTPVLQSVVAGVYVVIATEFMTPTCVRLDLFHGTARLPDEVTVPLVKSPGAADDDPYRGQVVGGPTEDLGKPAWVRLTNVSDGTARCYMHSSVVQWIPKEEIPREVGYVRLNSSKYNEWQVLAYAEGRDDTLLQNEKELYEYWLAEQPLVVEQQEYTTPVIQVVNNHNRVKVYDDSEVSVTAGLDEETSGEPDKRPIEFSDAGDDAIDPAKDSVDMLELTYISVMQEVEAEIVAGARSDDDDWYEHIPNEMELADYAHELAFLPDLTEPSSTVLEVLKRPEGIMIASGNALPLPAYGVVNAVTTIMKYAMPLVDDLLTDVKAYLWLTRLMQQADETFDEMSVNPGSVAPTVYCVPNQEGLQADAKKVKRVPEFSFPTSKKGMQSFLLQQKIGDAPILHHFDRQKAIRVALFANAWALSFTLMQAHGGKMHPVRFCGRVLKEAEMSYHPAEKEVLALLLLLKTCYTQLAGRTIHVYTRFPALEWVNTSKSLFGRTTQFAVMLSPWHLVVTRVKEKDCSFAQLLQAGQTSFVDLEDSLATVTPPTKGSSTVRMNPQLLYGRLPRTYSGLVVSFDGSAKTEKYGGYGSCLWSDYLTGQ